MSRGPELRDNSEALTISEAARLLGVSVRTLQRMRPEELGYFRINARGDRRYPRSAVERYVSSRSFGL